MSFLLSAYGEVSSVTDDIDGTLFHGAKTALETLNAIHAIEIRYNNIVENYISLESTLANLLVRHTLHPGKIFDPTDETHGDIARHLNNLLTSGSSYQAQVFRLKTDGERDSLKTACRHREKLSLDYRVIQQLRHYDQHFSLLVHQWSLPSAWTDDRKVRKHGIGFAMDVNRLALNSRFPNAILQELKREADRDGLIELLPLVRGYIEDVSSIHAEVRNCTAKSLAGSTEILGTIIQRSLSLGARPSAPITLYELDEHENILDKCYVSNGLQSSIVELTRNNRVPLVNFRKIEFSF